MSGTVGSAMQAREQLGARAELVHVIDSQTACGGQGLVVLAAAAAARAGADGAAVSDRARRARQGLKMWFSLDTLEYLRRGGRIGGAQAWLGGALSIKPILTVEEWEAVVREIRYLVPRNRFPDVTAQFRVTPRPKARRRGFHDDDS